VFGKSKKVGFLFGDFHGLPLKKHHKPSISDKNDESVVEEILDIYPHQKKRAFL